MYESVAELPEFGGTAWRAESGYTHDPGTTVADIIRFEREELGNEYPDVSDKLLQDLDRYSAFDAVWVNRRRKDCLTYLSEGESEEAVGRVHLPKGSKIITPDYCGGYLVLRGLAEPMLKKGGNPKAVPEGSIQTEIASLESEIKKKGRIISLIQSEARKEGLTDTQYLVRLQDIAKDLAIPKTRVSTLGFEELEIPVANAVEALVVGGERTISSGFHGALNKRWTIVLDGKVSEKLEKAAREAGLEVKSREAPKGTGHYFTDVSLPDIGRADVETAKKAFDKFAENYTGRSIVPTLEAKGGNPMPIERLNREQIANDLRPMSPKQGPPLPRGLGIRWPWRKS